MVNVAMISGWHVHAKGYAREINENENARVTAVWDEDEKRGKEWAEELGCKFIKNYDDVLKDPEIDAVAIVSPTDMHAKLILKAAKAGKHIFTEKVLTLKNEDAEKAAKAIKDGKIHFTISFPHKCGDTLNFVKKLVDDGKLGRITYARLRNCHSGSIDNWLPPHFYDPKQCGGGAMMDLGAHSMYLLNWFLGKPLNIQSVFTNITDRPVEDNAVCLIEFQNGAIGVSETGFVSRCDRYEFDISGTEGAARVTDGTVEYCSISDTDRKWVTAELPHYYVPSPINYWIDSIVNDSDNTLFGIDEAVELTKMMTAAYKSFRGGIKADV
ncbi:MAG: Gfo/Idh/MocA family oxidoreductase [Clostridiales bacterium]|nr:Gfo/Idh/MocA family oxidoreductase [Clostridiales bacterium]